MIPPGVAKKTLEITTKSLEGFNLRPSFPESAHPKEIVIPVIQLKMTLLKLLAEPSELSTSHNT